MKEGIYSFLDCAVDAGSGGGFLDIVVKVATRKRTRISGAATTGGFVKCLVPSVCPRNLFQVSTEVLIEANATKSN